MISVTKKIETLNSFDTITRFRLINAFIIAIGFNLFSPILIDLKGAYLLSWVITMFMITETLMVKTDQYVVDNFTMSDVYRMTVVVYGIFTLIALTYFWNPTVMVYLESTFGIIDITIFSVCFTVWLAINWNFIETNLMEVNNDNN